MNPPYRLKHNHKYILNRGAEQVSLSDLIQQSYRDRIPMHSALHKGPKPKRVFGYQRLKHLTEMTPPTYRRKTPQARVDTGRTERVKTVVLPEVKLNEAFLNRTEVMASPYFQEQQWAQSVLEEKYRIRVDFDGQWIWRTKRV